MKSNIGKEQFWANMMLMVIAIIFKTLWVSVCVWAAWNVALMHLIPSIGHADFIHILLLCLFLILARSVTFPLNTNKPKA